jgi:hypothetical protein
VDSRSRHQSRQETFNQEQRPGPTRHSFSKANLRPLPAPTPLLLIQNILILCSFQYAKCYISAAKLQQRDTLDHPSRCFRVKVARPRYSPTTPSTPFPCRQTSTFKSGAFELCAVCQLAAAGQFWAQGRAADCRYLCGRQARCLCQVLSEVRSKDGHRTTIRETDG